MKKATWILMFAALFLFMASCNSDVYFVNDIEEVEEVEIFEIMHEEESEVDLWPYEDAYERCNCGEYYAHEVGHYPTPPININERDGHDDEFLAQFDYIHYFEFAETHLDWRNRLVITTEEPLRDLSFISIGWATIAQRSYYYTTETHFTIDEFLPGEAFMLDVVFFHYLVPRGGLTFIDSNGERQFMGLAESMRGGCWPHFLLFPFDDRTATPYEERVNSVCPTAMQHNILTRLLGEYQLGDIIYTDYVYQHHFVKEMAVQYRFLHFDVREIPAHELIEPNLISRGFTSSDTFGTQEGDVIFVHFDFFNDTWLMIDIGDDSRGWGGREYIIIELADDGNRCECGASYAHDVARPPTPPINIIDHVGDEFLEQFERIHHFDFADWDTDWRNRIVFWTDEPVREMSFISLSWVDFFSRVFYYASDAHFTIDEFLPGQAFVLDVAFSHYLIPRGGLSFIDNNGEKQYLGILESMAGICACWPHFCCLTL